MKAVKLYLVEIFLCLQWVYKTPLLVVTMNYLPIIYNNIRTKFTKL